jgi:Asp-tRNA(Asn)/Glu-tRNA(Gln) amidotransferase A subunit family amidase
MTAAELAVAIRRRKVSPVEVIEATLERIGEGAAVVATAPPGRVD